MDLENNIFGIRLRKLRKERHISQDQLCNHLNSLHSLELDKSLISRYENGKHLPKFSLMRQLADFFGVSTDYLMGLGDSPYNDRLMPVDLKKVPLLGTIRAGEPIYMLEEYENFEFTDNAQVDFALKVTGQSMIGARIYPGDTVFVRHQSDVYNGEIAVVVVDDESATLKRVYKEKNKVILHPENPAMNDMVFAKSDLNRLRILGKVLEVKFKL